MRRIIARFLNYLYSYGKAGAGMASCRGVCEPAIPNTLKEEE